MRPQTVNPTAVSQLLDDARAVLVSADRQTRARMLGACDVLLTFGDAEDVLRARELQRAIVALDEKIAGFARGGVPDEDPQAVADAFGGAEKTGFDPPDPWRDYMDERALDRQMAPGWWILPAIVLGLCGFATLFFTLF